MVNSSQRLGVCGRLRQWFSRTPDRALDQAYEAALKIRQIEANYFSGNPISAANGQYSPSAYSLLQKDRNKYLGIIKRQMAVFRTSRNTLPVVDDPQLSEPLPDDVPLDQINGPAIF